MIYRGDSQIEIKTASEIDKMRKAGSLLAKVAKEIVRRVEPGISTISLDRTAYNMIIEARAEPAFLGYHGFPATLCTSVNDEIVHGIPSERKLKLGDIISIDLGLIKDGFCADMAISLPVGDIDEKGLKLLTATEISLYKGIEKCICGNRLGDISNAIQESAESYGFTVVREYSGHGIGRSMHEPPQILNYGKAGTGPRLKSGMVFAIEPMVNEGDWRTAVLDDDWTVVTIDGSRSAHFEHTVYISDNGPEILTRIQ